MDHHLYLYLSVPTSISLPISLLPLNLVSSVAKLSSLLTMSTIIAVKQCRLVPLEVWNRGKGEGNKSLKSKGGLVANEETGIENKGSRRNHNHRATVCALYTHCLTESSQQPCKGRIIFSHLRDMERRTLGV